MRRDTKYLSVFSLNAQKYGPEKTPHLDTFHAVSPYNNLKDLQAKYVTKYVIAPIDKATNNIVFICPKFYAQVLVKELGYKINTYFHVLKRNTDIIKSTVTKLFWRRNLN